MQCYTKYDEAMKDDLEIRAVCANQELSLLFLLRGGVRETSLSLSLSLPLLELLLLLLLLGGDLDLDGDAFLILVLGGERLGEFRLILPAPGGGDRSLIAVSTGSGERA